MQTDSLEEVEVRLQEVGCPYKKALVCEGGIMVTQVFFVSAARAACLHPTPAVQAAGLFSQE